MIKSIMGFFGYIPTKTYIAERSKLLKEVKELIEQLNEKTKYADLFSEKLRNHMKELQDLRKCFHDKNRKYEDRIEVLENQVKGRDGVISELKTEVRNLKRKNTRLLTKQGQFKETVTSLEQENKTLKDKAVFWELYGKGAVDKLDYICFGSVLPKVIRALDLSKYTFSRKNLKYEWYTSDDVIGVSIHEDK